MYLLVLFWALLALFWVILDDIRGKMRIEGDSVNTLRFVGMFRWAIRYAGVAVVPVLFSLWILSSLLGFGYLWDHFFPVWVSETATGAGEWFVDYILDNVLWQVSS